jgi:HEAT repeat protein
MDMHMAIGSDPKILFAFWLGVAVLGVTLSLLAVILVMRQVVSWRERAHLRAVSYWGGILADSGTGDVPALGRRDVSGFIDAWVSQAARPGSRLELLHRIADAVGLERHLFRLLERGNFHDHIAAITAIGHLRRPAHFDRVTRFIDDRSPIVSLCAARALMQMDPSKAVSLFVPQIVRREDWSRGHVAAILQEADTPALSKELSEATLRANADVAPRLVRFLGGVSPEEAAPIIRGILASDADDNLVSTCLQVIADPADLDLVRPLLAHPRWHVRMQAAAALGRLGGPADEAVLAPLLGDEQWWVRYRAAQAMAQILGDEAAAALRDRQADRFARDILDQVFAEKKFGIRK